MATFDTSRTTYGSTHAAGRLTSRLSRAIAAVIAWNDARVTRNALGSLTDRELEDIGLSRSDIDYVADHKITR
ncbi:MAG: DUF1127 domain-containing protein [Pseudomonadota bacterium]